MAGATLTPKITIRRRLPKSVRVILIAVLVMTAAEVENMAQLRPIQEARRRVWRWGEDELWFEQVGKGCRSAGQGTVAKDQIFLSSSLPPSLPPFFLHPSFLPSVQRGSRGHRACGLPLSGFSCVETSQGSHCGRASDRSREKGSGWSEDRGVVTVSGGRSRGQRRDCPRRRCRVKVRGAPGRTSQSPGLLRPVQEAGPAGSCWVRR